MEEKNETKKLVNEVGYPTDENDQPIPYTKEEELQYSDHKVLL